jgi:ribosome-interacting GTPase 1
MGVDEDRRGLAVASIKSAAERLQRVEPQMAADPTTRATNMLKVQEASAALAALRMNLAGGSSADDAEAARQLRVMAEGLMHIATAGVRAAWHDISDAADIFRALADRH